MAQRVPKTRDALAAVALLWPAPAQAGDLLDEAELLPSPTATVVVHGDLHVRHVLVDDRGELTGVIDWGDVCRADPAADLSLYWSMFPPEGREAFLSTYGVVTTPSLLRARVLALFLSATLASYGQRTAMPDLMHEALSGLERTLTG